MRKFLIAAVVAVVAVMAVGTVAFAANVYDLPSSKTTGKKGKGSPSNPIPKGVSFDYTVKDSAGPRGLPVDKYSIGFQGLTSKYQKYFPTCSFNQASPDAPLADVLKVCKKAVVGGGRIESLLGPDVPGNNDPNNIVGYCNLKLTLIHIPGGLAIRLDADNPPIPTSQDGPLGCIVATHTAIKARYKERKIGGVASGSLEFSTPLELRHNSGLVITVARVQSNIKLLKKKVKIKGKKKSVGFYTAIGCGKKRAVQVTFTDEAGVSTPAKGSGPC